MTGLRWIARLRGRQAVMGGPQSVELDGGGVFPRNTLNIPVPKGTQLPPAAPAGCCLTADELNLVVRLDDWWGAFLALPSGTQPLPGHHDRQEAQRAVYNLQRLVLARMARRQHPGLPGLGQ